MEAFSSKKVARFVLSAALLTAASNAQLTTNSLNCVTSYNANTDYFPQKMSPAAGDIFTVTYTNNTKTLYNKYSNQTLILYQCGTPEPQVTSNQTLVLSVPLQTVSLDDTTVLTYLEILGARSAITLSSVVDFVNSPCFIKYNQTGAVAAVDAVNATHATEQYAAAKAQFGFTAVTTSHDVAFPATSVSGIATRTSWIRFMGTLFNKEALAAQVETTILTNYACINSAASASAPSTKVKVVWSTYSKASDYNNNTATWTLDIPKYKYDLVVDAGAQPIPSNYITTPTYAVTYTNLSDWQTAVANADILIDGSFGPTNYTDVFTAYGLSSFSNFKFVQNKKIYRFDQPQNALGSWGWYESAVPFIHVVLADIVAAVNPKIMPSSYVPTYVRNVFTSSSPSISSASQCTITDLTAAMAVPSIACPSTNSNSNNNSSDAFTVKANAVMVVMALLSLVLIL